VDSPSIGQGLFIAFRVNAARLQSNNQSRNPNHYRIISSGRDANANFNSSIDSTIAKPYYPTEERLQCTVAVAELKTLTLPPKPDSAGTAAKHYKY